MYKMKYTAEDFLRLRTLILKNSVLNRLLIATLSKQETPVLVGTSLTRLYGKKLREEIQESKGNYAKLPRFIMVNILVALNDEPATIMHSYKDFSPVIQKHTVATDPSYITYLRRLVAAIFNLYSLNASKADKIFSALPQSLSILLETNNISSNYWKTGFSKKLKKVSMDEIKEEELETYHNALRERLSAWRNFNLILIQIINENNFKFDDPEIGKVVVTQLSNNQLLMYHYSYTTENFQSYILEYASLSPVSWEHPTDFLEILKKK